MTDAAIAFEKFSGLTALDYSILIASVSALFLISYFKGREERDTRDYFLGSRKTPVWVGTLSFVATEISAMTIVGIPPIGYMENWEYLQFFLGSAAARVLIAFVFIPAFYKFNCTTIYEFLRHRFGAGTQYAGSSFFFVTRLFASGVRLYAASLAVAVIMGWDLWHSIVLFTAVSVIFIGFGGIKAVLWTGTFESIMFFAAGASVAGWLVMNIDGGLPGAWQLASDAGKLSVFNLGWGMKDPNLLWAALLNGVFGSMAAFGTDQELMQRLLTLETRRESQKTLIYTIFTSVPLTWLYLAIGTLLYVFYRQNSGLPLPENADKILSHFTVHVLPSGLKGLVLTAVVLASIDSPLSSLSSSFVTDIYRPLIRKDADERHYLFVSRASVVCFGFLLALIAWACSAGSGRMLWLAFKVNGVTAGSLLGVFLLGLLTARRANRANVTAMVLSSLMAAGVLFLSERGVLALGWSWIVVIGTVSTFSLAWFLGPLLDPEKKG